MSSNGITKLLELAERCERVSGTEQRKVMEDVAYAVWGDVAEQPPENVRTFWDRALDFIVRLRAGAFDRAAEMLIPYDLAVAQSSKSRWCKSHQAKLFDGFKCVGEGNAKTPALALCAASLRAEVHVRAQASQEPSR